MAAQLLQQNGHMAAANNATVAVFSSPETAELAVFELRHAGFDVANLSVAGKDTPPDDQVSGYYSAGDGIRYWGGLRQVWGSLWELLNGWAFFAIPGVGPVLVAGPMAKWLVRGLENAPIFGGLGPVGAALHSLGISRDRIAAYESALAGGKFLLVMHGSTEQIAHAEKTLQALAG